MRVVLCEAAHAREAGQLAAFFVTVDRAELRQAQRQVAVGAHLALVDHAVMRAVHRLDQEFLVVHFDGRELAVAVVRVVPGRAVQVQVADVGCYHGQVTRLALGLAHEVRERLAHYRALRLPQHEPLAHQRVDHEQVELLAQHAVITFPGFFQHVQVFLQFFGLFPGGAVDAREHLVLFVAAPVGPGGLAECDADSLRVDLAAVGHVRPPAEVLERVLLVGCDRHRAFDGIAILVRRALFQPFDQLDLVDLILEDGFRFAGGYFFTLKLMALLDDLLHPLFDALEILLRQRARQFKVVVEAVLDRRADGDLGFRELLQNGLGHDVRCRVTDAVQL